MAISNLDVGQYMRVQTYWARHHEWLRGTTWDYPPMPSYVMWLMQRGVVDVLLDGKPFSIKAGEVWLRPYTPNRILTVREDAEWLTLGFDANLYGDIDVLAPLAPAQWQPTSDEPLKSWLEQLVKTERADSWEGALIHSSLTRAVVAWCWNERGGGLERWVQESLSPWLHKVLESMRQHPEMAIGAHIVSSGYSAAQFRRNFEKVLGCSPQAYLSQIRMERGRHLLETTTLPISHVAEQAGFANPEHFSRVFTQYYGTAPSRYRQFAKHAKT